LKILNVKLIKRVFDPSSMRLEDTVGGRRAVRMNTTFYKKNHAFYCGVKRQPGKIMQKTRKIMH
jgi:hypothetical protein